MYFFVRFFLVIISFQINLSFAEPHPNHPTSDKGKMVGGLISELPTWFKESFLEIADDVAEASDNNKHLMLYMHLNGCPYCYKMVDEGFKPEPNRSTLIENFDIVDINIKGSKDVILNDDLEMLESDLAKHFKVMFTPTLVFLNSDATPVYKISGYRSPDKVSYILNYVNSKSYLDMPFSSFVKSQHRKPTYELQSHPQFANITNLSKSTKPLMVIFEDKFCDLCSKYHSGLFADQDIQDLMKKYTVVRLDANSNTEITTPPGLKSTPAKWVADLSLDFRPGIVLFNENKEIARITGLLYKYHFSELLRYVGNEIYFEYPDSFYDYLSVRTEDIISSGGIIDIGDTMKSISFTK